MNEHAEPHLASEATTRSYARANAERIFGGPISEWDDMDFTFFIAAKPYRLDEALDVALEMGHKEAVGAIAVSAHMLGSDISRPGPYQDLEAAAQYAAVVDRITTGFQV